MSIQTLSKELQHKSGTYINEVPTRIQEDLAHIREWLQQQPHIHARTDDQWLLSFLRGCKFSLQRVKEKLDMFYTMRTMVPEFFTNRDPLLPEIQAVLKLGLILPSIRTAQQDLSRVIFIRSEPVDPSKIPFVNVLKTTFMVLDIIMNEDNCLVAGQQIFTDAKGITLNHIVQVTPNICKKSILCMQGAYPTRPKGFYLINIPTIFESVLHMIKPLLTAKLRNRLYVNHGNTLDNLPSSMPLSCLPKDYGGEGDSLQDLTTYWKEKVESYRDWFLEDAKYCSNEKMRPGIPHTADELFGVEGSFRKLDID